MLEWWSSLSKLSVVNNWLLFLASLAFSLTALFAFGIWAVSRQLAVLQEQRNQQVEQENLRLQARIEELKHQNLDLQIQIESNRVTVNRHLADRDIAESQAKILKVILASLKGQRLTLLTVPHNPEAAKFTDKLSVVMTESGLNVSIASGNPFGHQTPQNFALVIGSKRQGDAQIIRDALKKSGLATGWIPYQPTGDPSALELFVGPKD